MTTLIRLALIFSCLLPVMGCARRRQVVEKAKDPALALEQALKELRARRFQKAADGLTEVIFNFPGTRQASDAQFYLGECYFQSKDYEQAQTEFDFYLKNFPNGRFQEEAAFKLALSYLKSAPAHTRDQTRVLKARELFNEFLENYPQTEFRAEAESALAEITRRLVAKEFDAARLYFKAGEYRSALVYYNYIRQSYPDSLWPLLDRHRFQVCNVRARPGSATDRRQSETKSSLHLLPSLYFGPDSWLLRPEDSLVLKQLAESLRLMPERRLAVIGYCDPTEPDSVANQRSRVVKEFLMDSGVPDQQVVVESAQGTQPVAVPTEEHWKERRVELRWR
ncbi:MAG: outer membrane protein assembly factor BamD [candidate division WOR-3 bacterium]